MPLTHSFLDTAMRSLRRQLSDKERLDWLRLSRTENVGPVTFRQLLQRFGSAAAALDALPDMAARGGRLKNLQVWPMAEAAREVAKHQDMGARLIAQCEPDYPEALAATEDAPPLISVRGQAYILTKKSIAIVGARNASLNGRKIAETLARDLGKAGLIVVSGLARGIDTAAHQGSLASGTVAVLAGGVDHIYPEENQALSEQIIATGCLVSDMPFGSVPRAQHFPRRNRIISGLSLGIVVVEAALQSGSLITANRALDQGREVFAVPGSPLDPRCHGTNHLIRQGATLTEKASDILEQLLKEPPLFAEPQGDLFTAAPIEISAQELARARHQLVENLGPSPVAVDELIRQCHVSTSVVLTILLELELAGRVQRLPGNQVAMVGSWDDIAMAAG